MHKNCLHIFLAILLSFFLQSSHAQSSIVRSIYFKTGSSAINKKYTPVLKELSEKAASDSFGYVRIFAFTDTTGSEEYNDALSGKRAHAVYNYLSSLSKIDATNSLVIWLGESNDVYDLHAPVVHQQQRCVDIWMTFYKRKQ